MSYSSLQTDVASYTHRSDLGSMVQKFVELTEAKCNRRLRTRHQLVATTGTIASYEVALPATYVGTKWIVAQGYESAPLAQQSYEFVTAQQNDAGPPTCYAVTDDAWVFDGAGTVSIVYYRSLPTVVDNSTNWLDSGYYDIYLAGVLEEAFRYIRDDGQADRYAAIFASGVADLNRAANAVDGALTARRVR